MQSCSNGASPSASHAHRLATCSSKGSSSLSHRLTTANDEEAMLALVTLDEGSAMSFHEPLSDSLPPPSSVRDRLCRSLREVILLRGLLRLAERAECYRAADRKAGRSAPAR